MIRKFVLEEQVSRSMDTPLKQQPSLGENLENFLAPAGVINVGDHQDHNVNVVIGGDTHHQNLMGMDPIVMPSQQEHWLQMQIPAAINIHQHGGVLVPKTYEQMGLGVEDLRLWWPQLGSFGVVVLESVSGLKDVDFRQPEVLLVKKVHQFEVTKSPLEALADMGLNGEYNLKELMTLVSLGAEHGREHGEHGRLERNKYLVFQQ
ncbi:hypothetical protein HKD37_19G053799 [Glycine soja]